MKLKPLNLEEELHTIERCYILRALEQSGGDKLRAARLLGLTRRRFYRRLEALDLGPALIKRRRRK